MEQEVEQEVEQEEWRRGRNLRVYFGSVRVAAVYVDGGYINPFEIGDGVQGYESAWEGLEVKGVVLREQIHAHGAVEEEKERQAAAAKRAKERQIAREKEAEIQRLKDQEEEKARLAVAAKVEQERLALEKEQARSQTLANITSTFIFFVSLPMLATLPMLFL